GRRPRRCSPSPGVTTVCRGRWSSPGSMIVLRASIRSRRSSKRPDSCVPVTACTFTAPGGRRRLSTTRPWTLRASGHPPDCDASPMPEGDTIFRAARTLHRALAGRTITAFDTQLNALAIVDRRAPLAGRSVERVEARGKHLLIHFSGDLVLRTHLRMHGSWHIYRPGERWRAPARAARLVLQTSEWTAVAFNVTDAELIATRELARHARLAALGPDLLSERPDLAEARRRIRASDSPHIAAALLDQQAVAGIGNVY